MLLLKKGDWGHSGKNEMETWLQPCQVRSRYHTRTESDEDVMFFEEFLWHRFMSGLLKMMTSNSEFRGMSSPKTAASKARILE